MEPQLWTSVALRILAFLSNITSRWNLSSRRGLGSVFHMVYVGMLECWNLLSRSRLRLTYCNAGLWPIGVRREGVQLRLQFFAILSAQLCRTARPCFGDHVFQTSPPRVTTLKSFRCIQLRFLSLNTQRRQKVPPISNDAWSAANQFSRPRSISKLIFSRSASAKTPG